MKKRILLCIIAVLCVSLLAGVKAEAAGVSDYGALKVSGTQLTSTRTGGAAVLRGVSTHGINWDVGYPYISKEAFSTLQDDYGVNAIRLAMYTTEYFGYCDKAGAGESQGEVQAKLKERIDTGVKAATELDMYVIIDWHVLNDQNPNKYKKEAKAFFREMSKKYAGQDNVLYEICNEPNGGTTWSDITKYANEVIPVIRENDSDAVIIVGTPTWSQDVDVAAEKPLSFDNVMYTLHFYAATHKDSYRQKLQTALNKGLPVMVTEFGVSEASGDGNLDTAEAKKWLDLLDENGISYFAWSLSNKSESSALLKSGTSKKSGWGSGDLSKAGKWVFNQYKTRNGLDNIAAPGKVTGLKVKNVKGRKLKVSWKAAADADGYQILYSANKKFKNAKRKTVTSCSVKISKLKRNKTYYVKLRAYKKSEAGKKFGKYSGVKKIKIKK
ncbi:MAG: cellulase family glycosylhydrolase [Lachnospiraceae bacterium]|nr:cellulase family glycosylhydrolase [Lachnospiraceae bacterium]